MKDLDIFQNAPKDASPEELTAYFDEACGDDAVGESFDDCIAFIESLPPQNYAPDAGFENYMVRA